MQSAWWVKIGRHSFYNSWLGNFVNKNVIKKTCMIDLEYMYMFLKSNLARWCKITRNKEKLAKGVKKLIIFTFNILLN